MEQGNGYNSPDKFHCPVCAYEYDPAKGDLLNEVAPGTPFPNVPQGYACPVCGVPKNQFKKLQ